MHVDQSDLATPMLENVGDGTPSLFATSNEVPVCEVVLLWFGNSAAM